MNEKHTTPRSRETNETREGAQFDSNYGPWMVATRKKSMGRMGQKNGKVKSNQTSHINFKGNLDISQERSLEETGKDMEKSHLSDSTDPICETTRMNATQNTQKDIEMGNDGIVEDWKEVSGSGSQQETRQGDGNKLKNLYKIKTKGSNDLGVKNTKNLKGSMNLKCPLFSFGSKGDLSQVLKGQEGNEQGENGRNLECSNPMAKNRLGHMVQEESDGDSR